MLAQTIQFDDVDEMTLMFEHLDGPKAQLGYSTVWTSDTASIRSTLQFLVTKKEIVTYKVHINMSKSLDKG